MLFPTSLALGTGWHSGTQVFWNCEAWHSGSLLPQEVSQVPLHFPSPPAPQHYQMFFPLSSLLHPPDIGF